MDVNTYLECAAIAVRNKQADVAETLLRCALGEANRQRDGRAGSILRCLNLVRVVPR